VDKHHSLSIKQTHNNEADRARGRAKVTLTAQPLINSCCYTPAAECACAALPSLSCKDLHKGPKCLLPYDSECVMCP